VPKYNQPKQYVSALAREHAAAVSRGNRKHADQVEAEIAKVVAATGVAAPDLKGVKRPADADAGDGLESKKVAELDELLTTAGLSTDGKKDDKVARLREHAATAGAGSTQETTAADTPPSTTGA
jgi:hypothetical protein